MTAQTKLQKGFTLLELLIAISIIAILSVFAVALFTNVQPDARDSKRRLELEAIAKALELNKTTSGNYNPVTASQFSGKVYPGGDTDYAKDPQGYAYCIYASTSTTSPTPPDPDDLNTIWNNKNCTGSDWKEINLNQPGNTTVSWTICTRLENRNNPTVLCSSNTQ